MSTIHSSPPVLERSRELVAPALREAVDRLAPELRQPAAYHLGWTDAGGGPTAGDGGKCLRPALALLSAEAVGAPVEVGLPGAVAVELVHNFSLLHDDVMDQDTERRHRPTVWALFGVGRAIIVGDALLVLAQQVLADVAGQGRDRAERRLLQATATMIQGQAEDLAFESLDEVAVERCLAMAAGKTAALLACAAAIGADLACAAPAAVGALDHYGWNLGLSFQAVDDLLGIWGDPDVTGKPAFGDLRQQKKTLPVTLAMANDGSASRELAQLLAAPSLTDGDVARAAGLVEDAGGREATGRLARQHLDAALAALVDAGLRPGPTDELAALARFVCERDR